MNRIKNLLQFGHNKQAGATTVEFAIVAILFITMLFAIVEFGFLMFNKQIITNAAREGARLGIINRPADARIPPSEIIERVEEYSTSHVVSFGSNAPPVTTVANEVHGSGVSCTESNDLLTVDITYDYNFLFIPLATLELSSSARMRCE